MPKMVWSDRHGGLVPVDQESTTPAPVAKQFRPTPAPAEEPVATTLVDEQPLVMDEPYGSTNDEPAAEEDHDHEDGEHEEHDAMTEDEINETPTEEPNEFWSTKRVAIGVGALVLLFIIAVSLSSGAPYVLGLLGLACPALVVYFYIRERRSDKKRSLLTYVLLGLIALVVLVICWKLMAEGSSPTGPYGP